MKFNLTESERARILNLHMEKGYRKPLNEDLLSSDFGNPQPHHPEDFIELDYDSSNETIILYFNDETTETFKIETKSSYSPGAMDSYDSPGYDPELEVLIDKVMQVEPIQKDWEVNQFEEYLQSLGAMEQLNNTLHNDDAYESAADSHYSSRYDRNDELDENLSSEHPRFKHNAIEMYAMEKNKLERALYEIEEFIKKGDVSTAMHMTMVMRFLLSNMDEFVQQLKA
jgi:hypothetical protein